MSVVCVRRLHEWGVAAVRTSFDGKSLQYLLQRRDGKTSASGEKQRKAGIDVNFRSRWRPFVPRRDAPVHGHLADREGGGGSEGHGHFVKVACEV